MALGSINILGKRTSGQVVLVCLVVGALIAMVVTHLGGDLSLPHGHHDHHSHHGHHQGKLREGWVGAPIAYNMQQGVPSAGPAMTGPKGKPSTWYSPLDVNSQGLTVPLHKGELAIFSKNPSKPECCSASTYSTSTGCVCVTPEQMKYLNERGGNRTLTSLY